MVSIRNTFVHFEDAMGDPLKMPELHRARTAPVQGAMPIWPSAPSTVSGGSDSLSEEFETWEDHFHDRSCDTFPRGLPLSSVRRHPLDNGVALPPGLDPLDLCRTSSDDSVVLPPGPPGLVPLSLERYVTGDVSPIGGFGLPTSPAGAFGLPMSPASGYGLLPQPDLCRWVTGGSVGVPDVTSQLQPGEPMKVQISDPTELDNTQQDSRSVASEDAPLGAVHFAEDEMVDPTPGLASFGAMDGMEPLPDLTAVYGQMDMYPWSTYPPTCLGNMSLGDPGVPVGFAPPLSAPHMPPAPFIPPAPMAAPVIPGDIAACDSPINAPQWSVEAPADAAVEEAPTEKMLKLSPLPLGLVQERCSSTGALRVRWTVDPKKIKSTDKVAVSPQFEIDLETPKTFRLVLMPKVVHDSRGGGSFKKSKGKGSVQLKCEGDSVDDASGKLTFRFCVGDGEQRSQGSIWVHDFAQNGVTAFTEEWDFKCIAEASGNNLVVSLDVLP